VSKVNPTAKMISLTESGKEIKVGRVLKARQRVKLIKTEYS